MTKISPSVTVANPPAIVGVVQHGPSTLNKKPPLLVESKSVVGSARLHSRERSPSARIDSGHSVASSTSTSTVREMKDSGFFQLATDLTSSAVQKAVKTAGSITKEAASSLAGGSGTMIAGNITRELTNLVTL
ncbi:hypothetical protein HPB50_012183 [Hyalomma asiaticum]|uniref:Uncharacterized protein n=1 Tax=Hyalomma asiaticum TaxID=266040 RepID=A0ACB7SGS7_HYAAI|nr:hypothetical protein HPB50_012183 [Hyalomma asiaticum]